MNEEEFIEFYNNSKFAVKALICKMNNLNPEDIHKFPNHFDSYAEYRKFLSATF